MCEEDDLWTETRVEKERERVGEGVDDRPTTASASSLRAPGSVFIAPSSLNWKEKDGK